MSVNRKSMAIAWSLQRFALKPEPEEKIWKCGKATLSNFFLVHLIDKGLKPLVQFGEYDGEIDRLF